MSVSCIHPHEMLGYAPDLNKPKEPYLLRDKFSATRHLDHAVLSELTSTITVWGRNLYFKPTSDKDHFRLTYIFISHVYDLIRSLYGMHVYIVQVYGIFQTLIQAHSQWISSGMVIPILTSWFGWKNLPSIVKSLYYYSIIERKSMDKCMRNSRRILQNNFKTTNTN